MNGRRFSKTLEECLLRLDRGESLPDVLADFPELVEDLKPLLLVAMACRAFPVPVPNQTAIRLGRNQMLAEMNRLEIKKAFRRKPTIPLASRWVSSLVSAAREWGFNRLAYSYRLATVALVLFLAGGFLTINASAASQPGDLLYNFKLRMQRVGLIVPVENQVPSGEEVEPVETAFQVVKPGRGIQVLDSIYGGNQVGGKAGPESSPGRNLADPQPDDGGQDFVESGEAGNGGNEEVVTLNEVGKVGEEEPIVDQEEMKKADKEVQKAQKEAEKEDRKEQKQAEKEERKAQKEADKEERKEQKQAEKEERKEQKQAEKEDKKSQKEAQKEETKKQKENQKAGKKDKE